jgi:hypothetical protein
MSTPQLVEEFSLESEYLLKYITIEYTTYSAAYSSEVAGSPFSLPRDTL